jgi:hypothetical protein
MLEDDILLCALQLSSYVVDQTTTMNQEDKQSYFKLKVIRHQLSKERKTLHCVPTRNFFNDYKRLERY